MIASIQLAGLLMLKLLYEGEQFLHVSQFYYPSYSRILTGKGVCLHPTMYDSLLLIITDLSAPTGAAYVTIYQNCGAGLSQFWQCQDFKKRLSFIVLPKLYPRIALTIIGLFMF